MSCTVDIANGDNRWVLARTDRDAPSRDDVVRTAGAFLGRVLSKASPAGQRTPFDAVPGFDDKWIVGAARPIQLETVEQPHDARDAAQLARPAGEIIATVKQCPVLHTVRAERPWLVVVDFAWRAPSVAIDWPRRRVSDLGVGSSTADHDLDWLLLSASWLGASAKPDETIEDELLADATDAARKARRAARLAASVSAPWLAAGLTVAGILGVGYIVSKVPTRRART